MTRPTVGTSTERLYARLPEVYRDADAAQGDGPNGYPLLRYLSGVVDQLSPVELLIARLTYTPLDSRADTPGGNAFGLPAPWRRFGDGRFGDGTYGDPDTADLVDPITADAGWLPWLAQLLGISVTGLTVAQQRARLASPEQAWAHGTPEAIEDAARAGLAAGSYVDLRPHVDGDPFVIGIVTKRSESADDDDPVAAAEVERPAGYRLVRQFLEDLVG